MKIYTKSGDQGETSLLGGKRVSKTHLNVGAYGEVDELNSLLGVLETFLPPDYSEIITEINRIQSDLLGIGAWLALEPGSTPFETLPELRDESCVWLETSIDRMQGGLPGLKDFILPGGHPTAAWAQFARTVCRRAERKVVLLMESTGADGNREILVTAIKYLNRLSDYLFVLGRYCNHLQGVSDKLWKPC